MVTSGGPSGGRVKADQVSSSVVVVGTRRGAVFGACGLGGGAENELGVRYFGFQAPGAPLRPRGQQAVGPVVSWRRSDTGMQKATRGWVREGAEGDRELRRETTQDCPVRTLCFRDGKRGGAPKSRRSGHRGWGTQRNNDMVAHVHTPLSKGFIYLLETELTHMRAGVEGEGQADSTLIP